MTAGKAPKKPNGTPGDLWLNLDTGILKVRDFAWPENGTELLTLTALPVPVPSEEVACPPSKECPAGFTCASSKCAPTGETEKYAGQRVSVLLELDEPGKEKNNKELWALIRTLTVRDGDEPKPKEYTLDGGGNVQLELDLNPEVPKTDVFGDGDLQAQEKEPSKGYT